MFKSVGSKIGRVLLLPQLDVWAGGNKLNQVNNRSRVQQPHARSICSQYNATPTHRAQKVKFPPKKRTSSQRTKFVLMQIKFASSRAWNQHLAVRSFQHLDSGQAFQSFAA